MPNGRRCGDAGVRAAQTACALESAGADGARTIVMGLDQHRAQITAEWIDTATGEIGRARVTPAHRESVRRFLGRFRGRQLEVALEATTGWRFVVEELHAIGARAHLAEPAETERAARQQEARQDRPRRRAASARAVDDRAAAGVVDPAGAPAGSARAGAAASHPVRSARRVAAADPGGALSPRLPAAPIADHRRRAGVACAAAAAADGARADHRRDRDGRRARGPDRPARSSSCATYARRQPGAGR